MSINAAPASGKSATNMISETTISHTLDAYPSLNTKVLYHPDLEAKLTCLKSEVELLLQTLQIRR
jgi:hypothetical protein